MAPIDSEFPGEQHRQKNFEKKFMLGRDLVITIKLAQFLTDRAQSGTNRFRECPEQKN